MRRFRAATFANDNDRPRTSARRRSLMLSLLALAGLAPGMLSGAIFAPAASVMLLFLCGTAGFTALSLRRTRRSAYAGAEREVDRLARLLQSLLRDQNAPGVRSPGDAWRSSRDHA